jgi:hypothetical protein
MSKENNYQLGPYQAYSPRLNSFFPMLKLFNYFFSFVHVRCLIKSRELEWDLVKEKTGTKFVIRTMV